MATDQLQEAPAIAPQAPPAPSTVDRSRHGSRGRSDDYTGETFARTRPADYRKVLGWLAAGRSAPAIARALKLNERVIYAIKNNKQGEILNAKRNLVEISRRIACRAAERLEDRLAADGDNIPTSALVPIYGVAVDKLVALTAEQVQPTAQLNVNLNITDAYSEFLKVSQAIKQAVAKDVTQPNTFQLPDSNTATDKG